MQRTELDSSFYTLHVYEFIRGGSVLDDMYQPYAVVTYIKVDIRVGTRRFNNVLLGEGA